MKYTSLDLYSKALSDHVSLGFLQALADQVEAGNMTYQKAVEITAAAGQYIKDFPSKH